MSRVKYAQIHIGDFLSGCIEMDATEGGAFFFLIMAHYQRGDIGLEDDDQRMARIAHCSLKVWKRIKERVLEKFYLENGFWKNERVVEECLKVSQKVPKRCPKVSQVKGQVSENKRNTKRITSNQKPISNKPPYIPPDIWDEYLEHRKNVKAQMTDLAISKVVKQLDAWKAKGHDPTQILETAIANGWKGIFEPKEKKNEAHNRKLTTTERNQLAKQQALRDLGVEIPGG